MKNTYSPLAANTPRFTLAPFPRFRSFWINRTEGCVFANAATFAAVSSVDPSSTTISSDSNSRELRCRANAASPSVMQRASL